MSLVSGDVTVRAGSQDYIGWQLLKEDGVTPIDLSGAIELILKMKHRKDKTTKNFSTDDNPQKFFVVDDVNGKVQLRPTEDDFPLSAVYEFYVDIIDGIGSHPVPENKNYLFRIKNQIT